MLVNFGNYVHHSKFIMQKLRPLRKWILAPFIIPICLFIRLISPIILIRTGQTYGSRIGHFAANMEIYLCEKDHNLHPRRSFDIFFHPFNICNFQLKKMWDRHPDLRINRFAWFLHYGGKLLRDARRYEIEMSALDSNDVLMKSKIHLHFTSNEDTTAKRELQNMGVDPESTYVGLIARDSSYLKMRSPTTNYSYHDYRDSNIENYLFAAEELSKRGHFVIRMGARVKDALENNNPKIIDYATKGYRSDLLDIYIAAKCHFFVSGNAGFDMVPVIFRRPLVVVNSMPLELVRGWVSNSLVLFKKHWLREEKRFMTFREIIKSGAGRFYYAELFEQQGIELIENTPEEIRDVVIEMDERLKGTWETTEQDEELQRQFWSLFKPNEENSVFRCRTGTAFLRENRKLLI